MAAAADSPARRALAIGCARPQRQCAADRNAECKRVQCRSLRSRRCRRRLLQGASARRHFESPSPLRHACDPARAQGLRGGRAGAAVAEGGAGDAARRVLGAALPGLRRLPVPAGAAVRRRPLAVRRVRRGRALPALPPPAAGGRAQRGAGGRGARRPAAVRAPRPRLRRGAAARRGAQARARLSAQTRRLPQVAPPVPLEGARADAARTRADAAPAARGARIGAGAAGGRASGPPRELRRAAVLRRPIPGAGAREHGPQAGAGRRAVPKRPPAGVRLRVRRVAGAGGGGGERGQRRRPRRRRRRPRPQPAPPQLPRGPAPACARRGPRPRPRDGPRRLLPRAHRRGQLPLARPAPSAHPHRGECVTRGEAHVLQREGLRVVPVTGRFYRL